MESFANLPTSHLLGSVPAIVSEEKNVTNQQVPGANLQTFPPNNGGTGGQGYVTLGGTSDEGRQQPNNSWKGFFSISSYTQYFNVDTDIVLNRLISSLYPMGGDFISKIDANPDLYGACLDLHKIGFSDCLPRKLCYMMNKRSDQTTSWNFDVSYVNMAFGSIYGYALIVPLVYYFLLQYLGSSASLIRFWCLWGYSLFIFTLSSASNTCSFGHVQFLMVIPVEFLRWTIILAAGGVSSTFVYLNLRSSYVYTNK